MADKGGTGADFFKLTVKVDLIGKSNANKRLQEAFQGDIANLRQHLQSYPELQSQYIHCVKKKKKHLGFEFWLKNVNALEQLKLSTEKDSLVNALSDFSEKKGLGLDIGLGSQHLCFKCKIEEKQYAHAQAHFMEGSSESSDESDEADDQQKQSNEPPGAASGAEAKEKKVFGEFQKEEMTGKPNEGTQLDHVQSVSASVSATVKETSECVIVKQFYLYVPFKDSEIQTVIMESNCRELKGKRLKLVSDSKYLWEVIVELNPSTLDKHGTFCFVVDRIEQGYFTSKKVSLRDENVYKIDSSAIQRMFWKRISENGFLCHVQHIMLHCAEDTKDSILQMEALVTVVSPNLNNREIINVVKDLEKDNFLSDNKRSLMFVVLLGCFKQRKSLVEVVNDNVFDMLFHALCQLKRTDVLSSCMSNLHELSYFVVQRKYGKEFSLIHWMTHMFPFQDESQFLKEIDWFNKQSKAIATSDDEKTTALIMNVCTVIQDRIQKGESGKGPELLLSLIKNLPLSAAMKVHSQSIDKRAEFIDIREKIVDGLVSKIGACALKHYNDSNIGKLKYLWDHVKGESYAQLLTATFERFLLGLLEKTGSLNDDYVAFFEDEILFVKGSNQESLLQLIAKSPTRAIHDHMKALAQQRKYMPVIGTVAETWLETAVTKHAISAFSSQ